VWLPGVSEEGGEGEGGETVEFAGREGELEADLINRDHGETAS
jgi:hypothetical protein